MRKGIRWIASVLAGAIFMSNLGIAAYAEEPVTYLAEDGIEKQKQDGTEKTEEELKAEIIEKAKELPIETNQVKGWPKGPEICGESGVVMDMENGAILYGKSMDKKYYPASITKIMTALLALENSQMTDLVTFSEKSLECQHSGYAHIAMKSGEQITMQDALYAMMLASANEVAYAIGETVGGTYENFVKMMNERAKELGCENTNFVNTNGIFDENHYVSAKDMALIAKEAFSKEELLKIMQTLEYTIQPTNMEPEPRTFQQKHKMVIQGKYHDSRCIGGKTGYTDLSYNTLVTALEEDGRRIVVVILGSRDETYENTKELADYAFEKFQQIPIAEHEISKRICNIPEDATVTIPKDVEFADLKYRIKSDGELRYFYKDELVGMTTATIQAEQKIEKMGKEDKKEKEKEESKKNLWITIGIVATILILLAVFLEILVIRKRKAKTQRRKELQRRRQRMEERKWRE